MENITVGSILKFVGDDMKKTVHTREVVGICGQVVFTREVFEEGKTGPVGFDLVEDLKTWGWKEEETI